MIDPLVSGQWLSENYAAVTVCDARKYLDGRNARDAYLGGHLPGAVYVDLDATLSGDAGPIIGRHPLPDEASFARALGDLGVDGDATVVAYDDLGGPFAARLVWMLRAIGQSAALLDGGIAGWPGQLDRDDVGAERVQREVVPWPRSQIAHADDVASHIANGGVVIDSRARPRYRGDVEPLDPRAGHIPGAINLPFADNLDDRSHFLPLDVLRERFRLAGVSEQAIVYCGSGVTACHNALAMEAAGVGRPRLYVGSWSGWSSDPDRLAALGDAS